MHSGIKDLFILIVEDDEIDRMNLKRIVESFGARVDLAESGQDMLEMVRNQDYDCILLDYNLPDYQSIDLIPLVRTEEIHAESPIIIVTGMGNERLAVSAIKAGAIDYLPKKMITPDILRKSLLEAVNQHKSQSVVLHKTRSDIDFLQTIMKKAKTRCTELSQAWP
jgi:CheY-like chemotaxis protein